jgi:hypothetical protein
MKLFGDKINWGTVVVSVGLFITLEWLAEIYIFRPGVVRVVEETLTEKELN